MADQDRANNNAIYLIVLAVILVAAIVIFLIYSGKGIISSVAGAGVNISVTYKTSGFKENIAVKNVVLPLDSEKEVCLAFEQAFRGQFMDKYDMNCTLKEKAKDEGFWYAQTNIQCPANSVKCFGFCNGKIYESDGRIEDATCYMTAN
jgi:hypothetical protein